MDLTEGTPHLLALRHLRTWAGGRVLRFRRFRGRLPDPLVGLLKDHRAEQEVERKAARQLWQDGGWIFAKPDGHPLNPNTDYHVERASEGGRTTRGAAARCSPHGCHGPTHPGGPTPTAMAIMGWSSASMAKRYQHLIDSVRRDVAQQVGGLLWTTDHQPSETSGDDDEDGQGRVLLLKAE